MTTNTRIGTGLFIAVGVLSISVARAAQLRPEAPHLVDPNPSVPCVVPATFPANGSPTRVLFLATGSGVNVRWDGQPERLLWPRAQLKGGEQRPAGVFLATNFGVLDSPDGTYGRFSSFSRFTLVSPYGWVADAAGLWEVNDNGTFRRSGLAVASWRNVVGVGASTNYLYGPNLLWVGTALGFSYQQGLYQAVNVFGRPYAALGLPQPVDQLVTGICGVNGGLMIVYSGLVLRHLDSTAPYAPQFTDTGLPPQNYALQSLRYQPNDIDAVAYAGH